MYDEDLQRVASSNLDGASAIPAVDTANDRFFSDSRISTSAFRSA